MTSNTPFDLDRVGGERGLNDLVDTIRQAGDLALRSYSDGAAARVQQKPDRSPVTEADREVETFLRDYLERRYPEAGFFGEETGTKSSEDGLRFIVDPIDGTRAFIRGLGTWSILVGVEFEGTPVVGVANMPAANDLFVGVTGGGAFRNDEPLRVSRVDSLDAALVSHGGLDQFAAADRLEVPTKLGRQVYTNRGFADFDGYRQLLLGKADAMIDADVRAYDVCPAAVLVREAGGRFTSWAGEDTVHAPNVVASNGAIHDALLDLIGDAPASARH